MQNLIEALQIFLKYGNPDYPTSCEHDALFVNIDPRLVSEEDIQWLSALGFYPDRVAEHFYSFKFGSC